MQKLLSFLIISALVLLPLAGALDRADARGSTAMSDCEHGAAPAKSGAVAKQCPKCGDDGACSPDCLLKCLQSAAIVAPIAELLLEPRSGIEPASPARVHGLGPAPPAPPPRT